MAIVLKCILVVFCTVLSESGMSIIGSVGKQVLAVKRNQPVEIYAQANVCLKND